MDPIVSDSSATYHLKKIKVADEVWIATALLHREQPDKPDYSLHEIRERLQRENIAGSERAGVQSHIAWHCVANYAPQPGRYRMLYATAKARRRLYRPGDACDRRREGAKMMPERNDLPEPYQELLDWYQNDYVTKEAADAAAGTGRRDAILELRGLGRDLASDEHPDAHVSRLREGWS